MKKLVVIFAAVQVVGLACWWFWHHPYSSASSFLWGTGFVVLLPGDILGSSLVEKLFWESHVPSAVFDLLTMVAVVAVNAVVWFGIAAVCRKLFRRRPRAARPSPTA
jgi:hypothetical protein